MNLCIDLRGEISASDTENCMAFLLSHLWLPYVLSLALSLIALFAIGPVDALAVLLVRILLGGLVFGNPSALLYSLAGGALSYLVSLMLYKLLRPGQIFICGILCAVAHNVGQIAVAVLITRTPAILLYFPLLGVSGVVTGLFTGLAAGFAIKTLEKTN